MPIKKAVSKYPLENFEAGAMLRELAVPLATVARLIGIPIGTVKSKATYQGWRKDLQHKAEAKRLQRYTLGGSGAVPVPTGCRCSAGAARFLRLQRCKIALVSPADFKTIVGIIDGQEDHKSLILKELGLWDLESSGVDVEANADLLQGKVSATISATSVTTSITATSDDPIKVARDHAEKAGRNALRVASESPPPIKTWRDLEIASKLAGVATDQGVKAQPLINIKLLNDPADFGKPVDQHTVSKVADEKTQAVEVEVVTDSGDAASQAMADDDSDAAAE